MSAPIINTGLSPEQHLKMLGELAPLLAEMDKQRGYPRACPACGGKKWSTVVKGQQYECRACGYNRVHGDTGETRPGTSGQEVLGMGGVAVAEDVPRVAGGQKKEVNGDEQ